MQRQCGECQLCCRLLPMKGDTAADTKHLLGEMQAAGMIGKEPPPMLPDFDKKAGLRCQHQKHGVGCKVYGQRPFGCRVWTCAWLHGVDLPRPDHGHYVVDVVADEVLMGNMPIPAVQVWVDPHYPDAHRCPRLRAFLDQKGNENGAVAVIRYNEADAFVLLPPSLTGKGWVERRDSVTETERRLRHSRALEGATQGSRALERG